MQMPTARWERITLSIMAGALALGLGMIAIGHAESERVPAIVQYQLTRLPTGSGPIRMALLSDTHLTDRWSDGKSIDTPRMKAIVRQLESLRPDVIVIAGDFVGSKTSFHHAVAAFKGISAPLGVYAVPGNHDYENGDDATAMARELRAVGISPLINEHHDIGPIVLAGLDDLWNGSGDIGEARRALNAAGGKPVVLIAHNPDVFPEVPSGIALTLAGHTHGGHVVLPVIGSPISSSRFGARYRRGMIVERGRTMIVTSGVGGLAFRWNVPPEIAMITLTARPR